MTTTQTDAIMALADAYAIEVAETSPPLTTLERSLAMTKIGDARIALREALLAALQEQARNQQGPIKTWQQRLEETCPALGPMHIHACVEEVNDAMQAEINDLRVALQEQAREGEAVANSAILARGRFHAFKGEDGEPDDWEWFEEGTNCEHGCIDAVIVRADAIAAPQPAQPAQPEQADIADIIASALNVSRGTAYDLLRWRHQTRAASNEANSITIKNPPISTARIFAAMRAAHIHGSTT